MIYLNTLFFLEPSLPEPSFLLSPHWKLIKCESANLLAGSSLTATSLGEILSVENKKSFSFECDIEGDKEKTNGYDY